MSASFKPVSNITKYRKRRSRVIEHVSVVHQALQADNVSSDEHDEMQTDTANSPHSCPLSNSYPQMQQEAASNAYQSESGSSNENNEIFNSSDDDYVMNNDNHTFENEEIFFETVSSSSESEAEENNKSEDLDIKLAEWATKFCLSHAAVNELMHILRPYHMYLPKDARTLLKTTKVYNIVNIGGGSYYHFGISNGVKSLVQSLSQSVENIETISLQLNIDGLPLFKSSSTQFWPILGRVVVPFMSNPFIVGLFLGSKKPADVSEYTQELIQELNALIHNGMTISVNEVDHNIPFNLSCVICDTPARAFVKCIKGHSGYFGCDKCSQRGVWKGKMTFPETDAPRRTDASFDQMQNIEHHLAPSPFRGLPIGMVSMFPLDYMHLVCLGVMKRMIWLWMKGPLANNCRIGVHVLHLISNALLALKMDLPREFTRKGRSLFDVDRWKASEFRQFLLYTGPVVLKNHLSSAMYKHFLLLFVGIFCLSCDFLFEAYRDYAGEILRLFVQQFGHLYGEDMLVYNVHGLVHLSEDARNFGTLDNFSSFIYESFLGNLKKMIRKPSLPLQQVIRRLSEREHFTVHKSVTSCITAKKQHAYGPLPRQFRACQQFKQLHFPDWFISVSQGDNCILVGDNIALVRNILSQNDDSEKLVVYEKFDRNCDFFTYPLQSKDIRVYKVSHLSGRLHVAAVSSIICKCVLLPFHDKHVAIPMIHKFKL